VETASVTPSHDWLWILASVSLLISAFCALNIVVDILAGRRQKMWIMNVVWPITSLYAGPLGLLLYYRLGRLATTRRVRQAKRHDQEPQHKAKPFWQSVAVGVTHCGAGCTLGDVCAEWTMFGVAAAIGAGASTWFVFATWGLDYLLALLFGIAFQYFSIVPMRGLGFRRGLIEAFKADFLSLTSWQVGMYGWMAIALFVVFGHDSVAMQKTSPVFWFQMQVAMLAGFVTAYPVNWWLLRRGIKEVM